MFTFLLISIFLIANPIVGTPKKGPFFFHGELGLTPKATEEQVLDALYEWLLDWFNIDEFDELTMTRFFEFVGEPPEHVFLVNEYFQFHPKEIPTEDDNVSVILFKNLIRHMCDGLQRPPVQFTHELAKELDNLRRQALENKGFSSNNSIMDK